MRTHRVWLSGTFPCTYDGGYAQTFPSSFSSGLEAQSEAQLGPPVLFPSLLFPSLSSSCVCVCVFSISTIACSSLLCLSPSPLSSPPSFLPYPGKGEVGLCCSQLTPLPQSWCGGCWKGRHVGLAVLREK